MAKAKAKTKASANNQNAVVKQVFTYLSLVAAVLLFVIGGLALWGHNFAGNMVKTELSAQRIYFPEKGTEALDPEVYPDLQQYAGQLVDTPAKAKAYANGYIGRHLDQMADGKTYAEVSNEAKANPDDAKLQGLKMALFQGQTLRGVLLTSGYGFGVLGQIAGVVAYVAFIGSIVMLGVAYLFHISSRKSSKK